MDQGIERIDQQAAIVLDRPTVGVPALGAGRAIGNPSPTSSLRSDLATLGYDATRGEHLLHIFENTADLPRTPTAGDAEVTIVLPTLLDRAQADNGLRVQQYFSSSPNNPRVTSFAEFPSTLDGLTPTFSWTRSSSEVLLGGGDFFGRVHGSVFIEQSELASFTLTSLDGSRLKIDGELVLINDFNATTARTVSGTFALEAGWHDIELDFFHDQSNFESAVLRLAYQPEGGSSAFLAGGQIVPLTNAELFATSGVGATSHWLNYDGDDHSDLMVTFHQRQLDDTVGVIIDGAFLSQQDGVVEFQTAMDAGAATLLRASNAERDVTAIETFGAGGDVLIDDNDPEIHSAVVGDINGDGLEDFIIAMPDYLKLSGTVSPPTGRSFVFLGTTSQSSLLELEVAADVVIEGTTIGGAVSRIGDLNRDGYDEFAIARQREASGELAGGLFVYQGDAQFGAGSQSTLQVSDAFLSVARDQATTLGGGSSFRGGLWATSGDLNDDGQVDLIVGDPFRTLLSGDGTPLTELDQGNAYVFLSGQPDSVPLTGSLLLSQANRPFTGVVPGDQLGTLAASPSIDLNVDGVDDLLLGAAAADGLVGLARSNAGRGYVVYGQPTTQAIPNEAFPLINSSLGDFLVDRQTGASFLRIRMLRRLTSLWIPRMIVFGINSPRSATV